MGTIGKIFATGIVAAFLISLGVAPALAVADLNISKDADVSSTKGCEMVMYTMEVSNPGDETASNVVITDTLDGRWVFVAESSTEIVATHTFLSGGQTKLTWTIPTLAAGEAQTMKIGVASPFLNTDATIENSVTATANGGLSASASDSVMVEATPVSTVCAELGGGTTPVYVPGTGGALPSTGINPVFYVALILPLALLVERLAWAREQKNS